MKNGIIAILLQNKLINNEEVHQLQKQIDDNGMSCIEAVLSIKNGISEDNIMNLLALSSGIPLFDIQKYDLDSMPNTSLTQRFIYSNKILPLEIRENELLLAVVDPLNKDLFTQVSFITGYKLDLVLVNEKYLMLLLDKLKNSANHKSEIYNVVKSNLISESSIIFDENELINSESDDKPIIQFIHKIVYDAVELGASDIHFEPYEKYYRIRYRIDGLLTEISTPLLALKDKIAARIKIVSKIDIAEKRIPQDGRLRLTVNNNQIIDFRVSTLPTAFGEKIVLRILDQNIATLDISNLGLNNYQRDLLLEAINRPYGMILITGPTGSGKTVTLYSILNLLNNPNKNICTIEDPIEIPLSGINQVAVNDKTNLDFAMALRAFLRQDPDVIMVGEIRDSETASMAVKAAQTGHLVLSTLHTNNASSALIRLTNMGVATYNVGDALLLIVAERLVRKLCFACKKLGQFSYQELITAGFDEFELNDGFMPYIAVGCEDCNGSGYKGRIGIFEVMPLYDDIKHLILSNANSLMIEESARKNSVQSLRKSALEKVRLGITSLAEVEANINW